MHIKEQEMKMFLADIECLYRLPETSPPPGGAETRGDSERRKGALPACLHPYGKGIGTIFYLGRGTTLE